MKQDRTPVSDCTSQIDQLPLDLATSTTDCGGLQQTARLLALSVALMWPVHSLTGYDFSEETPEAIFGVMSVYDLKCGGLPERARWFLKEKAGPRVGGPIERMLAIGKFLQRAELMGVERFCAEFKFVTDWPPQ
jgi:hypothetical protein